MADQTSLFSDQGAAFLPASGLSLEAVQALHGHRERLRARLLRSGEDCLIDSELLELVLFRAIPRREVRSIAQLLLDRFGSFNRVLAAPIPRLREVQGVGSAIIRELKIVEAAGHRMAQTRILDMPVLSSWDALLVYCKARMAHLPIEQFRVLYMDRKNVLIADEVLQNGTVDHVPVFPRDVVKRALEVNATAMILVHNHPSGVSDPSQEDITMTGRIVEAAEVLGITVHDHLVIGLEEPYSFRAKGLI